MSFKWTVGTDVDSVIFECVGAYPFNKVYVQYHSRLLENTEDDKHKHRSELIALRSRIKSAIDVSMLGGGYDKYITGNSYGTPSKVDTIDIDNVSWLFIQSSNDIVDVVKYVKCVLGPVFGSIEVTPYIANMKDEPVDMILKCGNGMYIFIECYPSCKYGMCMLFYGNPSLYMRTIGFISSREWYTNIWAHGMYNADTICNIKEGDVDISIRGFGKDDAKRILTHTRLTAYYYNKYIIGSKEIADIEHTKQFNDVDLLKTTDPIHVYDKPDIGFGHINNTDIVLAISDKCTVPRDMIDKIKDIISFVGVSVHEMSCHMNDLKGIFIIGSDTTIMELLGKHNIFGAIYNIIYNKNNKEDV